MTGLSGAPVFPTQYDRHGNKGSVLTHPACMEIDMRAVYKQDCTLLAAVYL